MTLLVISLSVSNEISSFSLSTLNNIALEYFKNNDNNKGYACLFETVKIAFDFYLNVMFNDEKVRN